MTSNKPFENRRPPSSAATQGRRYVMKGADG